MNSPRPAFRRASRRACLASITATWTKDTVGPVAATASVAAGTYNASQSVTLTTAIDAAATYYTLDGTDPTTGSSVYTGTAIKVSGSDGTTVTLKAISYDAAGNAGAELTVAYKFDMTLPTVTGLADDASPTKSKTWSWGSSKDGSTYRYVIDQISGTSPSGDYGSTTTASQASGDGTYYIHVQAKDAVGNESAVVKASAILDNTAPTAAITYSPAGPYKSGATVAITATFNEAMATTPAPQVAISGAASLSGGVFQLLPAAGQPTLGLSLSGGGFTVVPGAIIPVLAQTVTASLAQAHAYPVPYRPSLGHTKITFTDLTQDVTVTVYTINGERVKTLGKNDSTATLDWNPVANDNGTTVASGLYLFIIKDAVTGEKKTGKIIVIR